MVVEVVLVIPELLGAAGVFCCPWEKQEVSQSVPIISLGPENAFTRIQHTPYASTSSSTSAPEVPL